MHSLSMSDIEVWFETTSDKFLCSLRLEFNTFWDSRQMYFKNYLKKCSASAMERSHCAENCFDMQLGIAMEIFGTFVFNSNVLQLEQERLLLVSKFQFYDVPKYIP